MEIAYGGPFGRGWNRMKLILFRPFDAGKWFVLGFTVFLAGLADVGRWGGKAGTRIRDKVQGESVGEIFHRGFESVEGVLAGSIAAALVVMIVVASILLWILFLWLSSRGHFLFLDNLVHNRARVTAPWKEYARQGNSLFLWRIVYTLVCLLAIGPLVALGLMSLAPLVIDGVPGELGVASLVMLGLVVFLFVAGAAYVDFLLLHLVAPVMYKHRLSATEAWRKFWPVLREQLVYFLLYGLFVLFLNIVLGMAVAAFGFMTCCFGFLLLAIPYVGTVILLPASVTFRGLDLEFLAQFGGEFDLVSGFAGPAGAPPPPEPAGEEPA
jgi:hypothetical protein